MIDLSQSPAASPRVQTLESEPVNAWIKDAAPAVEAPPDAELEPLPEAIWSPSAARTGIGGAVGPRVVAFPDGYRIYYTQMLARPGFPQGANDYDNCTARILSAWSADGVHWTPEPGVRLTPRDGGAREFRVVSSEVVPVGDGSRLRMYYECCPGSQSTTNSIRSALSSDGGLTWVPEPGARLEAAGCNFSAPRILFLNDGRVRLHVCERTRGIVSAVADEAGLVFHREPGVRVAQDSQHDSHAAFAPEIFRVAGAGYVMYYAGYSRATHAAILRATSEDGLTWHKDARPVISPSPGDLDAAKSSEMCLIRLPGTSSTSRYRLFYEACDGTARDRRGVWRIACAASG